MNTENGFRVLSCGLPLSALELEPGTRCEDVQPRELVAVVCAELDPGSRIRSRVA